MSTIKNPTRMIQGALLLSALLTGTVAAQQPAAQGVTTMAATTSTTLVAAPAPSPLFARADDHAPTIANAQADHAAAISEGGSHTIRVTTLVLVLAIVILVLLIT